MQQEKTIRNSIVESFRLWPIWLRMGTWDVRIRYRRTSIGIAWIFFHLFVTIFVVGIVYGNLLDQDISSFLPSLTIGLVIWNYLISSIVSGGNAFITSAGYITQIGLPIFVYILRFFVSNFITFLVSFLAYIAIAIIYQVNIQLGIVWVVLGVIILALISLLLISIFAYLNARFRDAAHLANIAMQVMFYITPILWPADLLRERAQSLIWIVDFNPLYYVLEIVRMPLLHSTPASPDHYIFVTIFLLILASLVGLVIRRYHRRIVYSL